MSNELYQHKKSDSIKWIITFVALILLSVSVIALGASVFGNAFSSDTTLTENNNTTGDDNVNPVTPEEPVSAEGLNTIQVVNSDLMTLSAMAYSGEPTMYGSTNGVKLVAMVNPEGAYTGDYLWELSWVNPSSEFAQGKFPYEYVQLEVDGPVAYVSAISPFAEQIRVSVTVESNMEIAAFCIVDYTERLDAEQYLDVQTGSFFLNNPGTADDNQVAGIVYDNAERMAQMYGQSIEIAEIETTYGTIDCPIVGVEYYLTASEEFMQLLQSKGIAAKNCDYTYIGDSEFSVALIINTLVGKDIIPYYGTEAVSQSAIALFNEAIMELDGELAFTIHAQVITEIEVKNFAFDFYFDANAVTVYPTSIELNMGNIIL